jgi:serine/threonine protein kinase
MADASTMQGLQGPNSLEPAIQAFYTWTVSNLVPGLSGQDNTNARFLPREHLHAHLSEEKVAELLSAVHQHQADRVALRKLAREIIAKECIAVFAILILINHGNLIQGFADHHYYLADDMLPFAEDRPPLNFPADLGVFNRFCQIQYHFCVRPLKNLDVKLPATEILPIRSLSPLGSGASAHVYRIEVDESLCNVRLFAGAADDQVDSPSSNVFALKRFNPVKQRDFTREVAAFQQLRNVENLIRYYGYFTVEGRGGAQDTPLSHNIVLEFANRGTLGAFWEEARQPFPATELAFWSFWNQIFGLAKALDAIHHIRPPDIDSDHAPLRGFHHDIRPANVLVSQNSGDVDNDFPYRFLLGDLGLADLIRSDNPNVTTEDPRGPLVYASPEIYRVYHQRRWSLQTPQAADVWSLGAVFSEALTWSTRGCAGLHEYRTSRRRMNHDLGPRFHDGTRRLRAVDEDHDKSSTVTRVGQNMAPLIVTLLEDMLQAAPEKRPQSFRLVPQTEKILFRSRPTSRRSDASGRLPIPEPDEDSAEESRGRDLPRRETAPASIHSRHGSFPIADNEDGRSRAPARLSVPPGAADQSRSVANLQQPNGRGSARPSPGPQPYYMSVRDFEDWRETKKRKEPSRHEHMVHLAQLKDRDIVSICKFDLYQSLMLTDCQIFIIDDSRSMLQHWDEVKHIIGLLAYAIKEYDDDGLEFLFTSEGKVYKAKTSQLIVGRVHQHKGKCSSSTNPSVLLSRIFTEYVKRYRNTTSGANKQTFFGRLGSREPELCKPCSFYILTDGVWQPGSRLSTQIVWLLQQLANANAPEYQVGISFILFGNDDRGTKRLRYLDNALKRKYQVPDVVDYEPSNGNALKMVLGSINRWWDGDDSDEDWASD